MRQHATAAVHLCVFVVALAFAPAAWAGPVPANWHVDANLFQLKEADIYSFQVE